MKLKAENIAKKFPRQREGANFFYALRETDFTLCEGELKVITGRSGGGKTTLLNILGGLLSPSQGKVCIDDTDLYAISDKELSRFRNCHIAVIPQSAGAIYTLNVEENILLPTMMYAKRTQENIGKAQELMERFDILDLREAMPSELSGGELRRMAIARALMTDPDFILADEPTGDLDDENTREVLGLLRKKANDGAGVLIISHDPEAILYADEVLRMDGGVLKSVN